MYYDPRQHHHCLSKLYILVMMLSDVIQMYPYGPPDCKNIFMKGCGLPHLTGRYIFYCPQVNEISCIKWPSHSSNVAV